MMVGDRRGGVWTSPNSKLMTMDYCNEVVQCGENGNKGVLTDICCPLIVSSWYQLSMMEKDREKKAFWQITPSTFSRSIHLLKTHNNNKGSKGTAKRYNHLSCSLLWLLSLSWIRSTKHWNFFVSVDEFVQFSSGYTSVIYRKIFLK